MTTLSPRQREIIRLIADGKAYKEIASEIGIAEGTVKLHVCRLKRKLSVRSICQAVAVFSRQPRRCGVNL